MTFRAALPGSDIDYYLADYQFAKHWPLTGRWDARFDARFAYGDKFGSSTSALPPYLNLFAGGPNSVRGYREAGLGPKDSLGNPYGGDFLAAAQFELMMPLPEKWRQRMRLGVFYDVGNAFSSGGQTFTDASGAPLDYGFEFSRLRQSVGLSARIRMPFGLLRLSYGVPIDADETHPNAFLRDDVEHFQVALDIGF